MLAIASMNTGAQVSVKVDVAQKGISVSPTLYGIFYEDINFASDGGLYAELIRNRSFEYNAEKPEHWNAVGSLISLVEDNSKFKDQDSKAAPFAENWTDHALRVEVLQSEGGVTNPGYWGINAVQGTQYKLSFWIKPVQGKCGAIRAALRSSDGKVLGETLIQQKFSKGWQKVSASIVCEKSDPKAVFGLTFEKPSTSLIDVVSLFPPTYKGRENGCRIDLAEKLEALHPAFMRFPGGCYVEGNHKPENAYHWQRTVGPIEMRPGHMNANWGYPTTDGLGFHEFLQLSEDLGAKPLYVVNIGIWHGGCTPLNELQPWIDECLAALEYANGPATSHYGKMRAENGHPEPFGIAYIEIGNENYNYHMDNNSDQSDHYPERFRMFYDAIKARFPEVQCIGNVESWGTDTPKWRNNNPVDILDEHYYRTPEWFVGQYHRFDNYDRRGPIIYPGEYAVTQGYGTTGNMNAAMGEAVFMMGMERNADIVRMSSYAPIFVNENGIQWRPDMIRFNSANSFGTPSYWVQQLFPTHIGNRVVRSDLEWSLPSLKEDAEVSPMSVGVATWRTQASYRGAQLFVEGVEVPLDMKAWTSGNTKREYQGRWSKDGDMLRQTSDAEECMFVQPGLPVKATSYTYKVQARKDGGAEAFMIIFNYKDERNFDWLNLGGWGNTGTAVETTRDGGRNTLPNRKDDHYDTGKWYDIQLDVRGDSITAYVDGRKVYEAVKQSSRMYGVYEVSTLDEETKTLYTKIVNLGATGTAGSLRLSGGKARSAEMVRLAAHSGEDENTMQFPDNIVPRPAKVTLSEGGRTLSFPVAPYSVNVITTKLE